MCEVKTNVIKALECPVALSLLLSDESHMGENIFKQFYENAAVKMISVKLETKEFESIDKEDYKSIDDMRNSPFTYVVMVQDSGCSLVYSVSKRMFKLCELKG